VLPNGTAFISDIGMCGDYNSVLGMDVEEPISRFLTKVPRQRFEPASGPGTLSGLAVEIDDETGLARACSAFRMGPHLEPAEPAFWAS
jgi:calcineurin-like phosphoesterase